MSAMAEMSKAIRLQIEWNSTDGTLKGLHDEVLRQYVEIVGAFYLDLKEELGRRS